MDSYIFSLGSQRSNAIERNLQTEIMQRNLFKHIFKMPKEQIAGQISPFHYFLFLFFYQWRISRLSLPTAFPSPPPTPHPSFFWYVDSNSLQCSEA